MERDMEEILDACTRLLAEMKSGAKESRVLIAVNKSLKRCLQETHQHRLHLSAQSTPSKRVGASQSASSAFPPYLDASLPRSPGAKTNATIERTEASRVMSVSSMNAVEASRSVGVLPPAPSSSPDFPSIPTPSSSPLQQYLCNDEEICKLVYACRMAIVGESGGTARYSVRMLTAALELAAVVLTSGVLPLELVAPAPTFAVAESTASGAKLFFSKLLGGKKHALPTSGDGVQVASSKDGRLVVDETVGARENMRDCLVDAVLAAVDVVQLKESSERLCFAMIVALKAAAAPRLSRKTSTDTQPSSFQTQQLCVHDARLVGIFRTLLGLCARPPGLSPILIDEAQKALQMITRALSNCLEQGDADVCDRGDIGVPFHDQITAPLSENNAPVVTPPKPTPLPATPNLTSKTAPALPSFGDTLLDCAEARGEAALEKVCGTTVGKLPLSTFPTGALGETQTLVTSVVDSAGTPAAAGSLTASPPLRLRGVTDMLLLLELCGRIVLLTPLFSISRSLSGSSGGLESGDTAVLEIEHYRDVTAHHTAQQSSSAKNIGTATEEGSSLTSFPSASLSVHTLVTALNFLLYSIVNGGPQFRKCSDIVQVLRRVVVPAVIRTSISVDLDVFRLSVNVLLSCCLRFAPQMMMETSTVFRHVYFRVLDSSFTSLEHKLLVLDAFGSYIEEPQLLLGLFLNYDCNTHSQSIYEMMIHYLGALAMPPAQQVCNSGLAADLRRVLTVRLEYDRPLALRRKALVSLLQVSDSNLQWIERFECDQEEESHTKMPRNGASAQDDANNKGPYIGAGASTLEHEPSDDGAGRNIIQPQLPSARWTTSSMSGGGPDSGLVTTANVEALLQARRYKDAFKRFLDLFNREATPGAAIEYLCTSVLIPENTDDTVNTASELLTTAEAQAPLANRADIVPVSTTVTASSSAGGSGGACGEKTETSSSAHTASRGIEVSKDEHEDAVPTSSAPVAPVSTSTATTTADADGVAPPSARQIAVFLRDHEDYIDKIVLGDYFAKCFRHPLSRVILEEWIGLHDFSGMTLDEALRLFLGGFKLLGEAQVVDKTMELFAAQYYRQNPSIFGSADTAFILSFSICMLNTDAHSPHIKNKMTKEGFLQNNKGISEGSDIDPSILGGIYDRITKEEIVLRPSPKCGTQPSMHASTAASAGEFDGGRRSNKVTTNLLDSLPLLRHLSPIAAAITDKVLLPMDAVGIGLFNSAQRKRQEMYQQELRATLREVMDTLQKASTNDAAHHAMFVTATSIENALPMWEVTVDVACDILLLSLQQMLEDAENYVPPQGSSSLSSVVNERETGAMHERVSAYMDDTQNADHFKAILLGLHSTIRVCCAFENVSHTEQLLERMFDLTRLTTAVVVTSVPSLRVAVQTSIPFTRLQILSTFLNLFVQCGSSFNTRGWQAAYKAISLVDALANGIEGMWQRQARRLLGTTQMTKDTHLTSPRQPKSAATLAVSLDSSSLKKNSAVPVGIAPVEQQLADLWFGAVHDVPASIADRASCDNRKSILLALRSVPTCRVDLWLDRLFDATQYPPRVQMEMTNGLAQVCKMELQYTRTFSLTKLFDFVSICASFSSRLQWRDLWANASEVFTLAGCGRSSVIALSSLDGLRLVALTYLMREELLNYSFQKEVLRPFELILMSNQNVDCRQKVMSIISEVIDLRAEHLASGWKVVFSCLSHAAAIPEVAPSAWSICEGVMLRHLSYVKDCFSDLIFCLTTFACSGVEKDIPLRAISYLVACGHWLQYGLEVPPLEVRSADAVTRWATRFVTAEQELAALHALGKQLSRVTLSAEPLTFQALLQKPTAITGKSKYHLWMSLFEGMVPIVLVHSSVRVRAHALSSIWSLLAQYAGLFDAEVQGSLFSGMVRPMLTTLLAHVPENVDATSPPISGGVEFDRFDYRLLISFALKGMLLACKGHAHLLCLACNVLSELVESTKITLCMLRNDYVEVVLQVCYDFAWAAPSLATVDALSRLRRSPSALPSSPSPSPYSIRATEYADMLYEWIPVGNRNRNLFIESLLHEMQQVGVVDAVRCERTEGWTELHQTPAAHTTTVEVSLSSLSATSVQSVSAILIQIRSTIYSCLTQGLLCNLQRLLSTCEMNPDLCLEVIGAMRRVLLGLSNYFLVTRDARAVGLLKSVIATSPERVGPPSSDQVPYTNLAPSRISVDTDASSAGRVPQDKCDSSATVTASPAFVVASSEAVPEVLLLIPYACVLIEFVAAFDLGEDDNTCVRNDLWAHLGRHVEELKISRLACLEVQRAKQASAHAEPGTPTNAGIPSKPEAHQFKEYRGFRFFDVFPSACYGIAARTHYYTAQTDPSSRQRVFNEWCYLLHICALKCSAILGSGSVLLQSFPTPDLIDLLSVIPSTLEEEAAGVYFNSCWAEMGFQCRMPPETFVELCAGILKSRI